MRHRIRIASALAVTLVMAIAAGWYITVGTTNAAQVNDEVSITPEVNQSGGYPTDIDGVIVRRPTDAELNAALGRHAQPEPDETASGSSGDSTGQGNVRRFNNDDIYPIYGAVVIDYTSLASEAANNDVGTWQIHRRLRETGTGVQVTGSWRLLADQAETAYTDADAAPGYVYDYRVIGQTAKGPKPSATRHIDDVTMEATRNAYGFGKGDNEVEIRVYPLPDASINVVRLTRYESIGTDGILRDADATVIEPVARAIVDGVRTFTDNDINLDSGDVYLYKVHYVKWDAGSQTYDEIEEMDDVVVIAR